MSSLHVVEVRDGSIQLYDIIILLTYVRDTLQPLTCHIIIENTNFTAAVVRYKTSCVTLNGVS